MVVLCLISTDFDRCSLALHKLIVSDVFKWLGVLASLVLSTLAPMFYFSNDVFYIYCSFFPWPNRLLLMEYFIEIEQLLIPRDSDVLNGFFDFDAKFFHL